ncbi:hypothetical protein FKW77_004613 [Venturia effusa]|uniref:Uncharacterized protein n=1 Tax=Venturia effusa TaxID=50376 RepID=A0A517LIP3_9PEZI|nr:hypothetical protein FKW77_004613 [Venturia effusa]
MANFLSLPLELRQQVLTHAFDDATLQDLQFNSLQFKLDLMLCRIDNDLFYETISSPNICTLAASLQEVDPQLGHDIVYILKRILLKFEIRLEKGEDLATRVHRYRYDLMLEWERRKKTELAKRELDAPGYTKLSTGD